MEGIYIAFLCLIVVGAVISVAATWKDRPQPQHLDPRAAKTIQKHESVCSRMRATMRRK